MLRHSKIDKNYKTFQKLKKRNYKYYSLLMNDKPKPMSDNPQDEAKRFLAKTLIRLKKINRTGC